VPQGRLGRKTTLTVLNPKAITVAELYGVLDKDTRDWTDGLLSSVFRSLGARASLPARGRRQPFQP
jgi:dynein heavy chain